VGSDRGVAPLLEALRSPHSCGDGWAEFLESYSPVLYQTARACTADDDAAADCYLHICERLSRNSFRRLLKFKPDGSASFTTWLRVVARNLCFDWQRSQHGRPRPFKSMQHLSGLELEIYNSRFLHGSSQQETLHRIQSRFPGLRLSELSEIEEHLQSSLTSRQQWLLRTRRQPEFDAAVAVADHEDEPAGSVDVADPSPSQETQIVDKEQQVMLGECLSSLPAKERLLLQLRFEQELSLDEIARLCGLQDAQRVHRTLAIVLKKLRHALK
jgi:RNA polymerase sigma factor (sigma-70 family)